MVLELYEHCFKCITNNWLIAFPIPALYEIGYYCTGKTRGQRRGCRCGEQWSPDSSPDSLAPDLLLTAHQPPYRPSPVPATYNTCLSFLISNEVDMATFQQIIVRSKPRVLNVKEPKPWPAYNWCHTSQLTRKPGGRRNCKKSEDRKQRKGCEVVRRWPSLVKKETWWSE